MVYGLFLALASLHRPTVVGDIFLTQIYLSAQQSEKWTVQTPGS